ncbi:unnamed protein product [Candida verbasci]|uniref:RNase III domain-containing protein n=1 Tax=Candida verbasci TaxID=1227364 RepID=A0A9W4TRM7_9ASCO|nr:unnamed protein product [Candida verbasci]
MNRSIAIRQLNKPLIHYRSLYLHQRNNICKYINPQGLKHELTNDNIQMITNITSNYKIPNDIALQIITHKSLGGGLKPHNEKLSIYGKKVFKLAIINRITKTTDSEPNLNVLASDIYDKLTDEKVMELFTNQSQLNKVMFWNNKSNLTAATVNIFYSLIGVINLIHGKAKAESFINDTIFSQIETIATEQLNINM